MSNNPVSLSGVPGAMCTYKNKIYLFFDKAYQTLDFEGGKLNSSSGLAAWEKPTNCVAQDEYIWIAAGNGLFTLHFDGDKHKILHADPQGWSDVHALGIYKDNLFAISKEARYLDTSSGIIKKFDDGNWNNMVCGVQCGKYLFMPSRAGPIWRLDMETNKYDQVSHGWNKSLAAAFVDDQLLIFADGIWLVDLESDKKRQIRKEDCGSILFCANLGRDVYVVKKDATFWKYDLDVTEAKIDLEWTTKSKVEPTQVQPQVQPQIQEKSAPEKSTAAISWYSNCMHHRLYTVENGKVVEYCSDGGNWYKGQFPETPGTKVDVVNWENTQIRVYIQQGDSIVEVADDGGWKPGIFKAKGKLLSASVAGCNVHVWVEDNGALIEHYWGNGWEQRPVKV